MRGLRKNAKIPHNNYLPGAGYSCCPICFDTAGIPLARLELLGAVHLRGIEWILALFRRGVFALGMLDALWYVKVKPRLL